MSTTPASYHHDGSASLHSTLPDSDYDSLQGNLDNLHEISAASEESMDSGVRKRRGIDDFCKMSSQSGFLQPSITTSPIDQGKKPQSDKDESDGEVEDGKMLDIDCGRLSVGSFKNFPCEDIDVDVISTSDISQQLEAIFAKHRKDDDSVSTMKSASSILDDYLDRHGYGTTTDLDVIHEDAAMDCEDLSHHSNDRKPSSDTATTVCNTAHIPTVVNVPIGLAAAPAASAQTSVSTAGQASQRCSIDVGGTNVQAAAVSERPQTAEPLQADNSMKDKKKERKERITKPPEGEKTKEYLDRQDKDKRDRVLVTIAIGSDFALEESECRQAGLMPTQQLLYEEDHRRWFVLKLKDRRPRPLKSNRHMTVPKLLERLKEYPTEDKECKKFLEEQMALLRRRLAGPTHARKASREEHRFFAHEVSEDDLADFLGEYMFEDCESGNVDEASPPETVDSIAEKLKESLSVNKVAELCSGLIVLLKDRKDIEVPLFPQDARNRMLESLQEGMKELDVVVACLGALYELERNWSNEILFLDKAVFFEAIRSYPDNRRVHKMGWHLCRNWYQYEGDDCVTLWLDTVLRQTKEGVEMEAWRELVECVFHDDILKKLSPRIDSMMDWKESNAETRFHHITATMKQQLDVPRTQILGCLSLPKLFWCDGLHPSMIPKAYAAIMSAMDRHVDVASLQCVACFALSWPARCTCSCQGIEFGGVMEAVGRAMKRHSEVDIVQLWGLEAIRSHVHGHKPHQDELIETGGLSLVVDSLTQQLDPTRSEMDYDHDKVRDRAVKALLAAVCRHGANQEAIWSTVEMDKRLQSDKELGWWELDLLDSLLDSPTNEKRFLALGCKERIKNRYLGNYLKLKRVVGVLSPYERILSELVRHSSCPATVADLSMELAETLEKEARKGEVCAVIASSYLYREWKQRAFEATFTTLHTAMNQTDVVRKCLGALSRICRNKHNLQYLRKHYRTRGWLKNCPPPGVVLIYILREHTADHDIQVAVYELLESLSEWKPDAKSIGVLTKVLSSDEADSHEISDWVGLCSVLDSKLRQGGYGVVLEVVVATLQSRTGQCIYCYDDERILILRTIGIMRERIDCVVIQSMGCIILDCTHRHNHCDDEIVVPTLRTILDAMERHLGYCGFQQIALEALQRWFISAVEYVDDSLEGFETYFPNAPESAFSIIHRVATRHKRQEMMQDLCLNCVYSILDRCWSDEGSILEEVLDDMIAGVESNDCAFSWVLEAMDQHPESKRVQEKGCGVLRRLASMSTKGDEWIGSQGGIELIVKAARFVLGWDYFAMEELLEVQANIEWFRELQQAGFFKNPTIMEVWDACKKFIDDRKRRRAAE